ncbi:helix-turn-helix transcriptional regulator [Anaeromyxobacter paludicola]|uniref:WYL domain-containing protein n=1 Tax=Anaeromyxobacter paludicola TaxID=2918171 RepID=A0ABN6N9L8_9BACT|nr:WYL domain-containing protein [Anaeromyxobacter paludicola]BDG08608.1 WYL domain-containing protein [Anaeromyxobacter paludicola]
MSWERIREEFSEEYGGSDDAAERKWSRDKDALREVGIPVECIKGDGELKDGYLIRPDAFRLRDLRLTSDEATTLWTAGRAALIDGNPWRDQVATALDKLRVACRALPPSSSGLPIRHATTPRERSRQVLARLGAALKGRKRLTLDYFTAARNEVTRRDVDLYGFALRRGTWLFAGFCHLRKERRVFYVDHVRELTVNAKRPAEHDYEIPGDFDITTYSSQQTWDYLVHAPLEAEVRLRGPLAPLAAQLLLGAAVTASGSESLARLKVRNLEALVRYVLSLGPDAELVSPEAGRQRAREMLDGLAARLGSEGRLA